MPDSPQDPSPDADPDAIGEPGWGRILDAAGVIAGIFLIAIVIDVWTDGRLISRHLRKGGEPGDGTAD